MVGAGNTKEQRPEVECIRGICWRSSFVEHVAYVVLRKLNVQPRDVMAPDNNLDYYLEPSRKGFKSWSLIFSVSIRSIFSRNFTLYSTKLAEKIYKIQGGITKSKGKFLFY